MARNYNAFLIRHWLLDPERGDRIEVVHVQSGDRSLVTSLSQAANWMQNWATSDDVDPVVSTNGPTEAAARPERSPCLEVLLP